MYGLASKDESCDEWPTHALRGSFYASKCSYRGGDLTEREANEGDQMIWKLPCKQFASCPTEDNDQPYRQYALLSASSRGAKTEREGHAGRLMGRIDLEPAL